MKVSKTTLSVALFAVIIASASSIGFLAWQAHHERSNELHACTLRKQGKDQDERFFSKGLTPSIEQIKAANRDAGAACLAEFSR